MTARKTPGKRLRATLDKLLPTGAEWDEQEQVTLDMIETAANRAADLQAIFDAEMAKPQTSPHRVSVLASELRQHESNIARLIATLDPQMQKPKSARHVEAANRRWRDKSKVGA
jgi:hypothetical protein